MPSLIGNKPNQVPTNGDLGKMAFQDSDNVTITGGSAVIDTLTADAINLKVDTDTTNIAPSLNLDFANSKVLDPRITFTRASTATYYDGKTVAKAEENLLINSVLAGAVAGNPGTTPTGWTAVSAGGSLDSISIGSDGLSNILTISATTNRQIYQQTITVSANTTYQAQLYVVSNANSIPFQQLFSWTTVPVGAVATYTINGVAAVATDVPPANSLIASQLTISTTAGTALCRFGVGVVSNMTGTVAVTRPQVEQRSAVSVYTPTTTQAITNYIPALQTAASGVARFDHNPTTGESLGLLIEESRANLLTYSDDFSNAAWAKNATTITANTITAPDGNLTGEKLVEDTTSSPHYVGANTTLTSGTSYTLTVYAKKAERQFLFLRFVSGGAWSTNYICAFDLSTGTATNNATLPVSSFSITPVGNGWYRCSITQTANATGTSLSALYLATSATNSAYTGDGYSGVYIWGAQLEAGSFPTSYIPTVASQVTRSADAASMTGSNFSSWYNQSEGTLYGELQSYNASSTFGITVISDGTLNNYIDLRTQGSVVRNLVASGAVSQSNITVGSVVSNSLFKVVGTYKVNDFAFSKDGASVASDSLGTLPVVTALDIGRLSGGTPYTLNGTIKKLQYFPKRLPNAELVEMTS